MAEIDWQATTPLGKALRAGRKGASDGAAGVRLVELTDFELVQVMARRGQWAATAKATADLLGAAPPQRPAVVRAGATALIWCGPGQFHMLAARRPGEPLTATSHRTFAGFASLSEQSDARALLSLSGSKARETLAKCCSLDLHPAAFPRDTAAATALDHVSFNLWRGDDDEDGAPVFFLLVPSTFAESLLGTILDAAAEYDIETSAARAWQP